MSQVRKATHKKMLDWIITQSVISSAKEQSQHSLAEVVLFVVYIVISVAAVVTAATLRVRGDSAPVVLAALSPLMYLLLLPFGVFAA